MLALLDFSVSFDFSDYTFGVPPGNWDPEPILYPLYCVISEFGDSGATCGIINPWSDMTVAWLPEEHWTKHSTTEGCMSKSDMRATSKAHCPLPPCSNPTWPGPGSSILTVAPSPPIIPHQQWPVRWCWVLWRRKCMYITWRCINLRRRWIDWLGARDFQALGSA